MLKKFIQSCNIKNFQIETDTGWEDVVAIHKTIPYYVWKIQTETGCFVEGADNHILFDENYNEVFIKDLRVNDKIITKNGPEKVILITKYGYKENMYDIELAGGSNHRFYANSILNHNTTNLGIRTDICMRLLPGLKVATIVPRMEQLKTIGDKYKEIESANRFKCQSKQARSNLFFKEFPHPGGKISQLRLWYILTNADKIRGNTYDWIDFDEYQDFDNSLETEILATQSRTKIPMLTFGGTSKSVDTSLEEKWINSSRGLWRLTCPSCKFDNYPTLKNNVMDMIRPKGLCCAKCGRKLNVRDGQWDFENTNALDLGRWGFHVPQIIVPANTEDESKWLRIYSNSQDKNNFVGFCEEYLGEATEEGSKEISINDLQNICVLGDIKSLQRNIFDNTTYTDTYTHIISGCDWGGSDYNPAMKSKTSFTAHVIMGVRRDGKYDLLDFTRYAGMDWDSVAKNIAKRHNEFRCFALASDFGGGAVYINNLRKLLNPYRVLAFKYSGPSSNILSEPSQSNFQGLYSLNRTEAISATFSAIKNSEIRAPNWEQCKSALLDLLNLVRIPSEGRSGETTFLYNRKPNKSDDFLHAITYAFVLAKLLQGKPLFEDQRSQLAFYDLISGGGYTNNFRSNYPRAFSG